MAINNYLPILIQIVLAVGIAVSILAFSHFFGQRAKTNSIKDSPYECGMLAHGSSHPQFAVKFYITAMLFIIFDVEIVFLFPWILTYREFLAANISIFFPILFFLSVIIIGLAYEIKKGALKWQK